MLWARVTVPGTLVALRVLAPLPPKAMNSMRTGTTTCSSPHPILSTKQPREAYAGQSPIFAQWMDMQVKKGNSDRQSDLPEVGTLGNGAAGPQTSSTHSRSGDLKRGVTLDPAESTATNSGREGSERTVSHHGNFKHDRHPWSCLPVHLPMGRRQWLW